MAGYDKEFLDNVVEEVKNGRDDLYNENKSEVLKMYDEAKDMQRDKLALSQKRAVTE